MSTALPAPTRLREMLRHIGPGLILTASIVGSGELIVTPKVGAQNGFSLLWFIIAGCVIKVFVQVELGRFAISRQITTVEALNLIPGPRFIVSWLVWFWLVMFIGIVFQMAGIVGGVAQSFAQAGLQMNEPLLALLTGGSCALLLGLGRYRVVENGSTAMVVVFTVCTIIAVGALQWTPYRITGANLAEGLSFAITFTTLLELAPAEQGLPKGR